MGEKQDKLRAMKDFIDTSNIRIQEIGISTIRQFANSANLDERAYVDNCTKWAVAQALLDNIAQNENGLSLRPILPDLDFYGKYNGPAEREWVQYLYGSDSDVEIYKNYKHIWPRKPIPKKKKFSELTDEDLSVTRLNDQTVMIIFGAQDLTPPELIAQGKPLFVNGIKFQRANIKVIGIEDISHIRTTENRIVLFTTPYLYKRRDSSSIMFHVSKDAAENTSNIALLGLVVEPIGITQLG